MADKRLHLPLPHLPKLHRPHLHLRKHHRKRDRSEDADESAAERGAEDTQDDYDECMPAVQRVKAEASEASHLFKLPNSEVCRPPAVHVTSPLSDQQNAELVALTVSNQGCDPRSYKAALTVEDAGNVVQDYIDSFDCGLQESHVVVMGRLSVFRWHLGFHSSGPFEYVRTLIIPFKVASLKRTTGRSNLPYSWAQSGYTADNCCDQHARRTFWQTCLDT